MPHLVRLTYASKTSSTPATIRQDLVNILEEARQHNFNHQIHGVLFYGNDHFFQCLEGRKNVVDALYEKLMNDPRHHHVQLLSYVPIDYSSFQSWNMKYVLQEEKIQNFLKLHHYASFNPYVLEGRTQDEFITLLLQEHESNAGQSEVVVGKEHAVRGNTLHVTYIVIVSVLALLACLVVYYGFNLSGISVPSFTDAPIHSSNE